MAMSPRAPLRPRTVGFPESGSGLGSARHFPEAGLPRPSKAQAMARVHPRYPWFTCPLAPIPGPPQAPSTGSGCGPSRRSRRVPRAPLPGGGVTRAGRSSGPPRGTLLPLQKLVRAHAPVPPPLSAFGYLVLRVFADRCHPLLVVEPSRHYPRNPCGSDWTHTPPCPPGASARFFPEDDDRPIPRDRAFRTREFPCHATSTGGTVSRLQSFVDLQVPTFARPVGCTHPHAEARDGQAVYTTHRSVGFVGWLPAPRCGITTCSIERLSRPDFHRRDHRIVGCAIWAVPSTGCFALSMPRGFVACVPCRRPALRCNSQVCSRVTENHIILRVTARDPVIQEAGLQSIVPLEPAAPLQVVGIRNQGITDTISVTMSCIARPDG